MEIVGGGPVRELILRIIAMCGVAERRGSDPFAVEVREALETLRTHLPRLQTFEDLCLDAEALNSLTRIIKLQGDWVKHRSTSLYVDPLLLEYKLRTLDAAALARALLRCWRPAVGLDFITPGRLREAVAYWNRLPKLSEHAATLRGGEGPQLLEAARLRELGFVADEEFKARLEALLQSLREACSKSADGRVSYWKFIRGRTFQETVERAYLASFLVTYGHARLKVEPLEDNIFLYPASAAEDGRLEGDEPRSLAIPLDWGEVRRRAEAGGR